MAGRGGDRDVTRRSMLGAFGAAGVAAVAGGALGLGGVRAVVEQSDGTLLAVKREVKVTVGGCGG